MVKDSCLEYIKNTSIKIKINRKKKKTEDMNKELTKQNKQVAYKQ